MFESGAEIAAGGILALLLLREIFAFLKSYQAKRNGGNPGHNPGVDLSGIEGKLDKLSAAIDGLAETQARTNRALDDLAHSGDKTRQAIGDQNEILEYLRKAERARE